jgi:hypothetical protein
VEQIDRMANIKEPYNKFVINLQESFLTLGAKKRIQFMIQHIDFKPDDILLDVGGNTGKIRGLRKRLQRNRGLRTKTCGCRIW